MSNRLTPKQETFCLRYFEGMTAFYQDNDTRLFNGDCRDMSALKDGSVQMVVTSPPYWGLRKYAGVPDLIWGGDAACVHEWGEEQIANNSGGGWNNPETRDKYPTMRLRDPKKESESRVSQGCWCQLCGAWLGGYGLEPTPEMYVDHTIEILREVWRVLRPDGVVFWNIADTRPHVPSSGIRPKDMALIPFRVALAAQADGWYIRSDIIWDKPNPMPESVRDRPTTSHEYILMFTKSARYYWDAEAVREDNAFNPDWNYGSERYREGVTQAEYSDGDNRVRKPYPKGWKGLAPAGPAGNGRNLRTVWSFNGDGGSGGRVYTVSEDCPIHSPLLHPDILQTLSSGEPQDWLLSHSLDRYGRLVPVLSASLLSRLSHTIVGDHLSSLGFHHHETECGQTPESVGDSKTLVLCYPVSGHKPDLRSQSHTTHNGTDGGPMPCSSDSSRQSDALIAKHHSKGIRKTVALIAGRDTLCVEMGDDTAHILRSLGCVCSYPYYTTSHLADVWRFPSQPYAAAHFATFPEALPERCILAATPEAGCCEKCGAPWERTYERTGHVNKREPAHAPYSEPTKTDSTGWAPLTQATDEWKPTCKCDAGTVPSIVLDPFAGSGTTLWVAKRLGRKSVGYELSPEYCELAVKRLPQQGLL